MHPNEGHGLGAAHVALGAHPALQRAYVTLRSGAEFVMAYALGDVGDDGLPSFYRTRMLGNQLRELDRFLSVLTEETALFLGDPGHDGAAFARLRNTANKLRQVRAMMALASGDDERLRAIGRISACLHHCAGRIHAAALRRDVMIAHGDDGRIARFDPASPLRLASLTRIRIGQFYRGIGDMLVSQALVHRQDVDFPALRPYLGGANVACDGI
ncbi:hypothetical protein [Flavisphingomonas formosensis]|uniref:hypothetical protein n=1 Tax=Flavisphingomonas formosensis TaxID=861534 RepID=UPI0012FC837D|nr:hypothetical protein [Sphingomonas formosensis]